jgi:hypothetical protein
VLRRVGEAPGWVVKVCFALLIAGVALLSWLLWSLCQVVDTSESHSATD